MNDFDVVVIGSGLAGLSCAHALVSQNKKVLVIESKSVLGGRTSSWNDQGMEIESGLHRYLGFYQALPEFLERCAIDLDNIIDWTNEIEIRLPDGGEQAVFTLSPLSEPIDTLSSVLGNNDFVSPKDKLSLSKFIALGLKKYKQDPLELDQHNIRDFAIESGLSQELITKIVTPLSSGLFFLPPQEYSAYVFFGTIAPYLSRMYALKIGAFAGGMTEVLINPIAQAIKNKGGVIKTNQTAKQLLFDGNRVIGLETNQGTLHTNHVVVAADIKNAQKLIKKSIPDNTHFKEFLSLDTMPALTIQLELPHPAHTSDRVIFSPNTILGSYAEQSRTTFKNKAGRLSIIVENPQEHIGDSDEVILKNVLKDLDRVGLSSKEYKAFRIVRLPHDFYALKPGRQRLRPSQKTTIPGLTLAGDYTNQEYLATMEGAVVSGNLAAKTVLETKEVAR
jgi:15-cis-phytoene desaturase